MTQIPAVETLEFPLILCPVCSEKIGSRDSETATCPNCRWSGYLDEIVSRV